ncbi:MULTISPECIES: potassium channel protein [Spirulina sp. CCY15215]|uniref:potassium channel family protein n=1 Tax=Spirulina sp. CCY15215 TaxID=2767591 RepID=UPI00195224F6|nr:potassium channel protein [Spirulina major]
MQESFKRILIGGIFFGITIIFGIVGYISLGWTIIESLYMVIITIFGVGYGEVKPLLSPTERIFTIFVIIAGTSSAVYIVGSFIQMLTEGEINRAFDRQRKNDSIEKLENHVIICGFGRIGQVLAKRMSEEKIPFVLIDSNPDRITKAEAREYLVLNGDATDENILYEAGIHRARILATVVKEDALNVFITLTARELNPNLTILARGELPSTEKKLRLAGANHIVLPATISATRMSNLITRPIALDFLEQKRELSQLDELLAELDVEISELNIPENSPLIGITLSKLEIKGNGSFVIIAVRKLGGRTLQNPHYSLILESGDTIILLGHQGDIPKFSRHYEQKGKMRYRGAKI